jgi:hypothetical protein
VGTPRHVDWPLVIAGALFMIWPLTYRRQVGRIHAKMAARGQDTTRFDQTMWRPSFRVLLWVVPILGLLIFIAGLAGT